MLCFVFCSICEYSRASLKDFDIPIGPWEQTEQERSKWRGLINNGAALYEKRGSVRRERKANTNGPPADSMALTCSTCNRQFRARIGIVSHQRTHQHTRTYSSFSLVRDERPYVNNRPLIHVFGPRVHHRVKMLQYWHLYQIPMSMDA